MVLTRVTLTHITGVLEHLIRVLMECVHVVTTQSVQEQQIHVMPVPANVVMLLTLWNAPGRQTYVSPGHVNVGKGVPALVMMDKFALMVFVLVIDRLIIIM